MNLSNLLLSSTTVRQLTYLCYIANLSLNDAAANQDWFSGQNIYSL